MDIIYAINENIKNYNIVNLIYSYLGEHPIIENTDITSIINYWEFVSYYEYEEEDNTIEEENNKFSYFYFNYYLRDDLAYENYNEQSVNFEQYINYLNEL